MHPFWKPGINVHLVKTNEPNGKWLLVYVWKIEKSGSGRKEYIKRDKSGRISNCRIRNSTERFSNDDESNIPTYRFQMVS